MLEWLPIIFGPLWLIGYVLVSLDSEQKTDELREIDRRARGPR